MTKEEEAHIAWIHRRKNPLNKTESDLWMKFYEAWFCSDEGRSAFEYFSKAHTLDGWVWDWK